MDSKTVDRVAEALGNAYNLGISEYLALKEHRDELRSPQFWRERAREALAPAPAHKMPETNLEVVTAVVELARGLPRPTIAIVNPYTREVCPLTTARLDDKTRSGALLAIVLSRPLDGEWWVVGRVARAVGHGKQATNAAERITACARLTAAPLRGVILIGDSDGEVLDERTNEEMPAWKP